MATLTCRSDPGFLLDRAYRVSGGLRHDALHCVTPLPARLDRRRRLVAVLRLDQQPHRSAIGAIAALIELIARPGNYRWGLLIALLYPVTMALALSWTPSTPDWRLYLDTIALGLANGGSLNASYLGAALRRCLRLALTDFSDYRRRAGRGAGPSDRHQRPDAPVRPSAL